MSGLDSSEARRAILGLAGAMAAAADQADSMSDAELGQLLISGRWTTIEVHEAGRRLIALAAHTRSDAGQAKEGKPVN